MKYDLREMDCSTKTKLIENIKNNLSREYWVTLAYFFQEGYKLSLTTKGVQQSTKVFLISDFSYIDPIMMFY